jgi:predicted nucleotidyltransferase
MTVQDKKQIFERLHEHETELKRFGVKRFGLFGSFSRGQQDSKSDIDSWWNSNWEKILR